MDVVDLATVMSLWEVPPDARPDALADFAAWYGDPVVINDAPVPLSVLVDRARDLHRAFSEQRTELLEVVREGRHLAFAFRRTALHTGTWPTPLGDVAPTGERVVLHGMDILTIEDGRIAEIRVLADDLVVLATAAGARL
jgi:predicted ester cyclase